MPALLYIFEAQCYAKGCLAGDARHHSTTGSERFYSILCIVWGGQCYATLVSRVSLWGPTNVMRSQWEIHSAKVTVTVGGRAAKLHPINNPNDDDDDDCHHDDFDDAKGSVTCFGVLQSWGVVVNTKGKKLFGYGTQISNLWGHIILKQKHLRFTFKLWKVVKNCDSKPNVKEIFLLGQNYTNKNNLKGMLSSHFFWIVVFNYSEYLSV